ncbi:MAG: CBS domain-containing protein [Gammaproteobacteria bacterium]|nr:CBS domain-containing protein [Gammaproteobacteria bacterium]MDH3538108.1 CBS domain-containing protein [Gammaproteobacteria bacterium]
MKIAELLHGRNREIVRIGARRSIAEAAKMLTDNKIGALLVENENGGIAGILSERDIVGGMAPHGADLHDVAVEELMTRDIIRCSPDDTVNKAMAMMTDRRIRHLPVFEGEDLIGFISIGDLVKCRMMEVQAEAEALRQYIAS